MRTLSGQVQVGRQCFQNAVQLPTRLARTKNQVFTSTRIEIIECPALLHDDVAHILQF
jgi:hypothetical protein